MQTVKDYVFEYFSKNHEYLKETYPGLSKEKILDEFLHYSHKREDESYQLSDNHYFEKLEKSMPLEYIRNEKFFYRSHFFVNEDVLIPRSETEILVEDSVNFINKSEKNSLKIAEVGVGSFALGLSILIDSHKELSFVGGDIDEMALEVARVNLFRMCSKLNPLWNISLIQSDRLENFSDGFDLIVTNPPYIKESARDLVHEVVKNSEPAVALFLKDEEYVSWFDQLFQDSHQKLLAKGVLLMEGHEDCLIELKDIAQKFFSKVEIKKDYTGRDRFLHCFKDM